MAQYKIKEIASFIGRGVTPTYVDEGIRILNQKCIRNNVVSFEEAKFTDAEKKYTAQKVIRKNDILINSTGAGTLGRVGLYDSDEECLCDSHVSILRLMDYTPDGIRIEPKYVNYYLHLNETLIESLGKGATNQTELSGKDIGKINIDLPSYDIQKKIVEVVSRYEQLLYENNCQIEKLINLAEQIYREWFVRFRYPGYKSHVVKNGLPENWSIKRIMEIGEVVGGGTPSTDVEEYWNGDVPWLSPVDLNTFKEVMISSGGSFITELGLKCSSAKMLPINTVLLSSRAPIGYVAIAKNEISTNQGFKSVICNSELIHYYYLYFFFKTSKTTLESYASGATFLELSGGRLKKIKIMVPPIELQNKFAEIIDPFIRKTDILAMQNKALERQMALILPRLMSGKQKVI